MSLTSATKVPARKALEVARATRIPRRRFRCATRVPNQGARQESPIDTGHPGQLRLTCLLVTCVASVARPKSPALARQESPARLVRYLRRVPPRDKSSQSSCEAPEGREKGQRLLAPTLFERGTLVAVTPPQARRPAARRRRLASQQHAVVHVRGRRACSAAPGGAWPSARWESDRGGGRSTRARARTAGPA